MFWGLTCIARADLHEPAAPRYLYPGAVFLLLIAVEAARGISSLPARRRRRCVVLLAFVTVANLGTLRNGGGFLRDRAAEVDGRARRDCSSPRRAACRPAFAARAGRSRRRSDADFVPRRGRGPRLARARPARAAGPVRAQPREPPTGR